MRTKTSLAKALREARISSGLSGKEAAERLGLDRHFLCNVEQGRLPFPPKRLSLAEKIYNPKRVTISISELTLALLEDIADSQE